MFKINKQQLASFAESSLRGFEERVVQHLSERLPQQCATLATEGLQSLVRKGIARAASHGITVEKDVSRFIGLMCVLGESFDEDPQLPWVAEVLGKEGPRGTSEKVTQLCELASEHLDEEAASALVEERVRVGSWEPFSSRTAVGQPFVPCPKTIKKRLYFFSS